MTKLTDARKRELFEIWFNPDDSLNYWQCWLAACDSIEAYRAGGLAMRERAALFRDEYDVCDPSYIRDGIRNLPIGVE